MRVAPNHIITSDPNDNPYTQANPAVHKNSLYIAPTTLSASVSSPTYRMTHLKGLSVSAIASGASLTGSFELQVSNDIGNDNDNSGVTNWSRLQDTVSGQTTLVSISGSSNVVWNVPNLYCHWARFAYTHGSGAGTLDVWFHGKGES